MINVAILSQIIGFFAGIGIMVAGCGYAYSAWKNGKNKYKDELIVDLKASLETKEKIITELNQEKTTLIISHQEQLTKLQKEMSALEARFEEQGKLIVEYKSILEGRDPATLKMLNDIKTGIDSLNEHQVASEKQTKEVAKTLLKSTEGVK